MTEHEKFLEQEQKHLKELHKIPITKEYGEGLLRNMELHQELIAVLTKLVMFEKKKRR